MGTHQTQGENFARGENSTRGENLAHTCRIIPIAPLEYQRHWAKESPLGVRDPAERRSECRADSEPETWHQLRQEPHQTAGLDTALPRGHVARPVRARSLPDRKHQPIDCIPPPCGRRGVPCLLGQGGESRHGTAGAGSDPSRVPWCREAGVLQGRAGGVGHGVQRPSAHVHAPGAPTGGLPREGPARRRHARPRQPQSPAERTGRTDDQGDDRQWGTRNHPRRNP